MPSPPESWPDLGKRLAGATRFSDLRWFDDLDSTNRYLLDEARAGAPEGVVAVTDHQSAGRGRLGRTWSAPPGSSLLVSVLLRPAMPAAEAHLVTMAAGGAACDAVFLTAGFAPSLKWPNDLVVGRLKLAGMLSEAELRDGRLDALVVGVGINVNWHDFPPEIAETATACNLVTGDEVDRLELLERFLERLDDRYATLQGPLGFEVTLAEYRSRCATLGREVRVELAGETVEGTAVDVNESGHLIVESGGSVRELAVGDVVHLR
ncbi:MAG: biotin--[acetyl-CoA-carboxylase] ligase [Actinobacteria bacterium]|nr:biotin--[acetyl-CoA-carboxylase] ligase [Actinomycetota bacterium]